MATILFASLHITIRPDAALLCSNVCQNEHNYIVGLTCVFGVHCLFVIMHSHHSLVLFVFVIMCEKYI